VAISSGRDPAWSALAVTQKSNCHGDGHSLIPNICFAGPQEDDNDTVPDERGAIKAIHHGQRFSRKLKRRLTQRTIAEARALKKQSKEAIHVLIYAAELVSKSF